MSRIKKSAQVAALGAAVVGGAEGLRTVAYPDPATHGKPWTICYGETMGVKKGDRRSVAECKAMLIERLDGFGNKVEACVRRPMKDETFVAFVSLAYNIGSGGFCKSSVVRLFNAGQEREACHAMRKFAYAAGVFFPGLDRRRAKEEALCLRGAA